MILSNEELVNWCLERSQPQRIASGWSSEDNDMNEWVNEDVTLVSQLIGALSPVIHKGLHQGWSSEDNDMNE